VNDRRAVPAAGGVERVDQQALDVAAFELGGEQEAGRASADDQHVRGRRYDVGLQ
jgi:hypothetical protein